MKSYTDLDMNGAKVKNAPNLVTSPDENSKIIYLESRETYNALVNDNKDDQDAYYCFPGAIIKARVQIAGNADISNLAWEYKYKGEVPTFTDLPTENLEVGDSYKVTSLDTIFAWKLDHWDEVCAAFELEIDEELSETSENPLQNKAIYAEFRKYLKNISLTKAQLQELIDDGTIDNEQLYYVSDEECLYRGETKIVGGGGIDDDALRQKARLIDYRACKKITREEFGSDLDFTDAPFTSPGQWYLDNNSDVYVVEMSSRFEFWAYFGKPLILVTEAVTPTITKQTIHLITSNLVIERFKKCSDDWSHWDWVGKDTIRHFALTEDSMIDGDISISSSPEGSGRVSFSASGEESSASFEINGSKRSKSSSRLSADLVDVKSDKTNISSEESGTTIDGITLIDLTKEMPAGSSLDEAIKEIITNSAYSDVNQFICKYLHNQYGESMVIGAIKRKDIPGHGTWLFIEAIQLNPGYDIRVDESADDDNGEFMADQFGPEVFLYFSSDGGETLHRRDKNLFEKGGPDISWNGDTLIIN